MNKIIAWAIVFFLDAWFVMLGIGVVHVEMFAPIKPVGFGTAVLLTALFGIGSAARSSLLER